MPYNLGKYKKRGYLKLYIRNYGQVFFFAALFLLGVLIGSLIIKRADAAFIESLSSITGKYFEMRSHQSLLNTFFASFSSSFALLFILFICGFCAVSQVIIAAVPFFRGLGFGAGAGFIYARNGLMGVGYVALILLPNILISTVALFFACRESMRQANQLFRLMVPLKNATGVRLDNYFGSYFALLMVVILSSFLDTIITAVFLRLFV